MPNNSFDVLIVGGGVAGLSAAESIMRAAPTLTFCVLEGRDRVGGRTHTEHPELGYLDMGGEFIGPSQIYSLNTARRLGIDMFDLYFPPDKVCLFQEADGSILSFKGTSFPTNADVDVHMVEVEEMVMQLKLNLFDPWNTPDAAALDAMTVEDWIEQHMKTPYGKQVFRNGVRSALSVETTELSVLYLMFYVATAGSFETLMEVDGGSDCIRLTYGMQQFSEKYADAIGRDKIRFGSIVKAIDQTGDPSNGYGARVTLEDGTALTAKRVIVAMSPSQSLRIEYSPALPEARQKLCEGMPMGRTIKSFVCYKEMWWREQYAGYALSTKGPASWFMDNCWFDPQRQVYTHPSLMAFIVGDDADKYQNEPIEVLKKAVLDQIAELFQDERARDPAMLVGEGLYRCDWRAHPLSGGCPAGVPRPGIFSRYGPALRAPAGKVHWAGSETATDWVGGYVNGAIQSGMRVATEVVTSLATPSD